MAIPHRYVEVRRNCLAMHQPVEIVKAIGQHFALRLTVAVASIGLFFWLISHGQNLLLPFFSGWGLIILTSALLLYRHAAYTATSIFFGFVSLLVLLQRWSYLWLDATPLQSFTFWLLQLATLGAFILLIESIVQHAVKTRPPRLTTPEQQNNRVLSETNALLTVQVETRTEELRLANAALAAREANLQQLIANLPAPVIVSGREQILLINEASRQLLGLQTLEAAAGRSLFDWVGVFDWLEGNEQRQQIQQRIQRVEQGEHPPPIELSFKDDNAQPFYLEIHSTPIAFDGKPAALTVLFDITIRRQAEQDLRAIVETLAASEEKNRSLAMNIPAVIFVVNEAEECIEANAFANTLLGYRQDEFLQQPLAFFIDKSQPKTMKELAILAEAWPGTRPELGLKCKDGRIVPVICRIALNFIPGCHLFVALDISERRATERQLRTSEEHFRVLVERSPAVIYRGEWSREPQLTYITPNIYQILGYTDKVLLQQQTITTHLHHDDAAPFKAAMQTSRQSGYGQFEYRIRHNSGSYRWVLDQWQFLPDSDEYVGYIVDITKRKITEKALASSRRRLRKLTRRLNTIHEEERLSLAREVHDVLGQNLAVLRIRLDQLFNDLAQLDSPLGSKVQKLVLVVDNTMAHVQNLSSRLRPLVLDELGLTAAIERLVYDFADQTEFTIDLDLPDQPPSLERDLAIVLYRIVQEALTNITRHAKASHIQIMLLFAGDHVSLTIQDNGCGFDTNLARSPKSLGIIGMAERIAPWDGSLHINSIPGQGTTVHVVVPFATVETDQTTTLALALHKQDAGEATHEKD